MPPVSREPNLNLITGPPDEQELRGMRAVVKNAMEGTIHPDYHAHRTYRLKQAPGKFRSINVALTTCDQDHVLCDLPLDEGEEPVTICLICDAGREMLGLNGKPIP
jgi:hypothetical protein